MNNLDAVALCEKSAGPFGAANDRVVEFDGEAFGREREQFEQLREVDAFRHVARFAVDLDVQGSVIPFRRMNSFLIQAQVFAASYAL